jgi:NADH-quinone oxidoreductase subunit H
MTFAVFFLAEYANMILIALLCALLFFGGWLSPVPELLGDSIGWLFGKTAVFMLLFLWFRATFPRYRYDQIMRLGWKVLLPVTIFWLTVEGVAVYFKIEPWFA